LTIENLSAAHKGAAAEETDKTAYAKVLRTGIMETFWFDLWVNPTMTEQN
jgi:hypothetical protein